MGLISKFEGKMEDTVEGAAERMGGSSLSPVQIAKKAEKQMRREKMVGAGKQFAPTLYTVLVSHEDDARMFGYYPTLAGETETYLMAKAQEHGLSMDGQPLVRFIADDGLKRGKFEVIAEMVAAPLIRQLRQEEMERYGLAQPQRRQPQPQPVAQPQPQAAYPPPTQPVQDAYPAASVAAGVPGTGGAMAYGEAVPDPLLNAVPAIDPAYGAPAAAADAGLAAAVPSLSDNAAAAPIAAAQPAKVIPEPAGLALDASPLPSAYVESAAVPAYADGTLGDPYVSSVAATPATPATPAPEAAAQPAKVGAAAEPSASPALSAFRQAAPVTRAELFDRTNNQVFPLTGAPMRIGRESARDIVVPDINASRTHAEIHQEPSGTWIIADLGSTNGTFLNGRQIKSAPLRPGDAIVVGTTELVFRNA